jgi:hypothetical protein
MIAEPLKILNNYVDVYMDGWLFYGGKRLILEAEA